MGADLLPSSAVVDGSLRRDEDAPSGTAASADCEGVADNEVEGAGEG